MTRRYENTCEGPCVQEAAVRAAMRQRRRLTWEGALWEKWRDAAHLPMEHPIRKVLRRFGLLREQRSVVSCLKQAQIIVTNLGVSHDRLSRRELSLLDDLWFTGMPTAETLVQAVVEDFGLDEEEVAGLIGEDDTYGDVRNSIAMCLTVLGMDVEGWWQDRGFAD